METPALSSFRTLHQQTALYFFLLKWQSGPFQSRCLDGLSQAHGSLCIYPDRQLRRTLRDLRSERVYLSHGLVRGTWPGPLEK